MAWFILDYIFAILAIIGMAAILCAIILFVLLAREGDVPDDDRHRQEDEEQMEYLHPLSLMERILMFTETKQ